MDTTTAHTPCPRPTHRPLRVASPIDTAPPTRPALTRRGFLRTAAIAGGGLVAASVVACAPTFDRPAWSYGPSLRRAPAPAALGRRPARRSDAPPHRWTTAPRRARAARRAPSARPRPPAAIPAGWSEHDVVAKTKVDRFLAAEYDELPAPNAILEPTLDGDVKVFELTIDEIEHRIDAQGRTARRARLQRRVDRPAAPGRRGRPRPRGLHEQPQGDDRASTSTARTCPTPSTACR